MEVKGLIAFTKKTYGKKGIARSLALLGLLIAAFSSALHIHLEMQAGLIFIANFSIIIKNKLIIKFILFLNFWKYKVEFVLES
ncbi:MAG: hypothetical protein QRY74_01055 [Chlamydia sp.]